MNNDIWTRGMHEWLADQIADGYRAYYVNFMFEPLGTSQRSILSRMHRALESFYSSFCTCFCHNPRSPAERERLPRLWLVPDLPVWKGTVVSGSTSNINSGLHLNGLMLIAPRTRFKGDVAKHVMSHEAYIRGEIARIDVSEVYGMLGRLTGYITKTIQRGRIEDDGILILPKTSSEMRRGRITPSRAEREKKILVSNLNASTETAEFILNQTSLRRLKRGR